MSSPPSGSRPPSHAFERLHPKVQRWIWSKGWGALRDVQEQAVPAVLAGTDTLLMAPTAGGKTEAAFLPIASALAEKEAGGLGCLCVSPLKALINDQHRRLEELFEAVDVPAFAWHGDIAQGRKRRALRAPRGVLLITPESLEALFVRRGAEMRSVWRGLSFVVVDELHAFIGTERGRQLQSLLHRVEAARGGRVPRIGLSATIGDRMLGAEFLRPGGAAEVRLIEDERAEAELRIQLRGYVQTPPKVSPAQAGRAREAGERVDPEDVIEGGTREVARHLFEVLRGGHHLVFANSRSLVEELSDLLRRTCERERLPVEFLPHHGSLAKELREEAEARLRDARPTTLIATTTLELGIDVGDLDSVAQVGVPPSVASLRQRLGRSGRREGTASTLRLYVTEKEIVPDTPVQDALRAQLFQATAMIELLVHDRFCEPPEPAQLHLSTLIQQLLSVIAGRGGARPKAAYDLLCGTGPFKSVSRAQFASLLRSLADHELIDQAADGDLVLGVAGEKIVDHYEFFAAFQTPEEYRLLSGSRELGSLPIQFPLQVGMLLIFAGQRWRVVRVDAASKTLLLEPASGGVPPLFDGGMFDVHERVREKTRELYESDTVPRYLNEGARRLLVEGRRTYAQLELGQHEIVQRGESVLLFPWASTRVMDTLRLWLSGRELWAENQGLVLEVRGARAEAVTEALRALAAADEVTAGVIVDHVEDLVLEKHDGYLPEELARLSYAGRKLDVAGARRVAGRMTGRAEHARSVNAPRPFGDGPRRRS